MSDMLRLAIEIKAAKNRLLPMQSIKEQLQQELSGLQELTPVELEVRELLDTIQHRRNEVSRIDAIVEVNLNKMQKYRDSQSELTNRADQLTKQLAETEEILEKQDAMLGQLKDHI